MSVSGEGYRRSDRHKKARRRTGSARRAVPPRPIVEPAPRMRVHEVQRKHALKRRLAIGAGVLAVLMLAAAAYGLLWFRSLDRRISKAALADTKLQQALDQPKKEHLEPFTVLITGSDARPRDTASRADTIIVARVDPKAKKVWLLSIPRDMRAEIPGHGVGKINAAKFYGGDALLIETIKDATGLEINHYVDIGFKGFVKAVDAIGGVWVDVDKPIDDWKADISPGKKAKKIEPGYQLLDGYHALVYVRSRDFPDADFTRMRHQQEFFKALAKQMSTPGGIVKLPAAVTAISEYMSSTLPAGEIVRIARALQGISPDDIYAATIPGTWKSPYVYPDTEKMQLLVEAMNAGRPFESTPTVEPVVPSQVSVTVRNGAGISGVAAAAADLLKRAGFNVVEVGNANQFVYDRTLVVYATDAAKAKAQAVAAALPTGDLVPSRGMYAFKTDVLVVVGKDWTAAAATSTAH